MEVCKKRKRSQPQRRRVKVCNVCGSEGFSNAFIYCSRCSDTRVHQYCVGIPPGNLNDVDNWVCEYCPVTVGKESCTCHVIASASDARSRCIMHAESVTEKSKSEMVLIPDQPEPLCFLYPLTCKEKSEGGEIRNCSPIAEEVLSVDPILYQEENERSVSPFMECPEALMNGQVLVVSSSGEIIIPGSSGIYDEISPQNAGDSPVCCFLTYDEELEGQVSSFMEYPAEISRELVLLVKPAGEAFIEYGLSSYDGSHFQIIVSMENIGHEETRGSYKISEEVLSTAPISSDYSSDYIKECERSGSSFMEYPESLMCGLVLVASPSGQLIISRSSDICDKFNPQNAEDSDTCHLLTYGVDLEALASSFMEYPEEISRELVLRVKPTGEITIDYGEMKSSNLVSCRKTDVCFPDVPDEFSKLDVQDNVVFEHMFHASDTMDAAIQQVDEDLDADDYESKHRMGNKKTTSSPSSINYGYIPPIRSGCKRPRSKRYYKFKHATTDKKTTSSSSITYGCIPPIRSGCKRPRSKRCKRLPSLTTEMNLCRVILDLSDLHF